MSCSSKPLLTLVGRGRLGGQIAKALARHPVDVSYARIDSEAGLLIASDTGAELAPHQIECLVICISARQPWPELLAAVQRQVAGGALTIARLYFISSCAVYAGQDQGFIRFDTQALAIDERTQKLLQAESLIRSLSTHATVVRLPGLTGPGYERYQPLQMAQDRSRHAVDIRAMAQVFAERLLQPIPVHEWAKNGGTEILTDGHVYWQGRAYSVTEDNKVVHDLAQTQRVYLPSMVAS